MIGRAQLHHHHPDPGVRALAGHRQDHRAPGAGAAGTEDARDRRGARAPDSGEEGRGAASRGAARRRGRAAERAGPRNRRGRVPRREAPRPAGGASPPAGGKGRHRLPAPAGSRARRQDRRRWRTRTAVGGAPATRGPGSRARSRPGPETAARPASARDGCATAPSAGPRPNQGAPGRPRPTARTSHAGARQAAAAGTPRSNRGARPGRAPRGRAGRGRALCGPRAPAASSPGRQAARGHAPPHGRPQGDPGPAGLDPSVAAGRPDLGTFVSRVLPRPVFPQDRRR